MPVDATDIAATIAAWRRAGITHAISIERCGRSADGAPRNMRGLDISSYTAPLDELFTAGPWETIAIGDGGNEIGMGSLPRELIAQHVDHGETIACVTPARHLIVAGVSNWGAYGLLGALAALRPDWRERLLVCLDEKLDQAILEATVNNGPAVDGVSRLRTMTVDNLDMTIHHSKLREIRALVQAASGMVYNEFVFEDYRYDPARSTLSLCYSYDGGPRFEEQLIFDFVPQQLSSGGQRSPRPDFPPDPVAFGGQLLQGIYTKGTDVPSFRNRRKDRGISAEVL